MNPGWLALPRSRLHGLHGRYNTGIPVKSTARHNFFAKSWLGAKASSCVPDWLAPYKPGLNLIPANRASPFNICNQSLSENKKLVSLPKAILAPLVLRLKFSPTQENQLVFKKTTGSFLFLPEYENTTLNDEKSN